MHETNLAIYVKALQKHTSDTSQKLKWVLKDTGISQHKLHKAILSSLKGHPDKRNMVYSSPKLSINRSWWRSHHVNEHRSILRHLKETMKAIAVYTVWLISFYRRPVHCHRLFKDPSPPHGNNHGDAGGLSWCNFEDSLASLRDEHLLGKKNGLSPCLPPMLCPQWSLTRHTHRLKRPHSSSVTIHGRHFLTIKSLRKVPFMSLSVLPCVLPSRDPKVGYSEFGSIWIPVPSAASEEGSSPPS